jgi:capsid protein
LSLSNFNQDIKAFTNYCRLHLRNIIGSGGQISHTHWICIQEALEEAYTEKFRLQMMDWSKKWRKQTGEGHDWIMMQYLAKVDLEYSRLLNLNQWKTNDPNGTIVALCAEIADLSGPTSKQATTTFWPAEAEANLGP